MSDEYFGPPLPPKVSESDDSIECDDKKKLHKRKRSHSSSSSGTSDSSDSSSDSSKDSSDDIVHKRSKASIHSPVGKCYAAKVYGVTDQPSDAQTSGDFIGPVIPSGFVSRKAEDGEDWGPKPPGDDNEIESTVSEIEKRAQRMKKKLMNPDDEDEAKPERESWMTELPPEQGVNFGVTARKFRMSAPSSGGDRSVWTETPGDRAKREQDILTGKQQPVEKVPREKREMIQKDLAYQEIVEEYNKAKKRSKSLLELHNEKKTKEHKKKHKKEKHKEKKKKKKKKSEEKEKEPERRPFDRDVDLKVNRIDDAQRKAIIKRSQLLGSRFGHGGSSGKFL